MQCGWHARSRAAAVSTAVGAAVLWLAATAMSAQSPVASRGEQVQPISAVGTWPSKPKRWALVIGVDRYADGQVPALGGASNDAKSIADALVRFAGFPQDQVILLASDQPEERQPTRGNILRRLSNLAGVVP